jgi:hypothetical protein
MAVIYPQPEDFAAVYKSLESLVDSPREITTTTDGPVPLGLVVADDVYQRYLVLEDLDEENEEPEKAPKRRGRPRRNPEPVESEQEPTP